MLRNVRPPLAAGKHRADFHLRAVPDSGASSNGGAAKPANTKKVLRSLMKDIKKASSDPTYRQQRKQQPKPPAQQTPLPPAVDRSAAGPASSSGRSSGEQLQELQVERVVKQLSDKGVSRDNVAVERIKQYAPVVKGPLALPGGPQWQALRRHIKYTETPGLSSVQALLVVEGSNDHLAVARAVNVPVYVCGGNRVLREHAWQEVQALPRLGAPVVVLTDPDSAGRAFRGRLDELVGPLHHAFLPEALAVTREGTLHKDAGNLGVEHAAPDSIRAALSTVVLSFGGERRVFTRERLVQLQLLNGLAQQVANVELRRRLVCALLGVGDCDGSQLVAALNRWFTEEQLEDACAMADERLAAAGVVVGGAAVRKADVEGPVGLLGQAASR